MKTKRQDIGLRKQEELISDIINGTFRSPRNVLELIFYHLPREEAEGFCAFLWGSDFYGKSLDAMEGLRTWNEKMGQYLIIEDNGKPPEDIPKMIDLWLDNVMLIDDA
jgi:hypothetical protein